MATVPAAAAPAANQSPITGRPNATVPAEGVAAGAPVGIAAGLTVSAAVPAVAAILAGGAAATTESVVKAFTVFLILSRDSNEDWVRRRINEVPDVTQQQALEIIGDENLKQREYAEKVIARIKRDAPKVDAASTPEKRKEALGRLVNRERVYARQRAESMAIRTAASLDRVVLQAESPFGAFWVLDENARSHTPDCVAMAGRFWPWEVLLSFHPPTHPGCRCHLASEKAAIKNGWLRAGHKYMDLKAAKTLAAKAQLLAESMASWPGVSELPLADQLGVLRTMLPEGAYGS